MTASSFGWLAHDDGERRRMMEVINLFRERGTLDELRHRHDPRHVRGPLLPGTSTIQTRARYFLFIPWMYQQDRGGAGAVLHGPAVVPVNSTPSSSRASRRAASARTPA